MPKQIPLIYEPDEYMTHVRPPPGMDQVTLCGLTDFIGATPETDAGNRELNCWACKQIMKYCQSLPKLVIK